MIDTHYHTPHVWKIMHMCVQNTQEPFKKEATQNNTNPERQFTYVLNFTLKPIMTYMYTYALPFSNEGSLPG